MKQQALPNRKQSTVCLKEASLIRTSGPASGSSAPVWCRQRSRCVRLCCDLHTDKHKMCAHLFEDDFLTEKTTRFVTVSEPTSMENFLCGLLLSGYNTAICAPCWRTIWLRKLLDGRYKHCKPCLFHAGRSCLERGIPATSRQYTSDHEAAQKVLGPIT